MADDPSLLHYVDTRFADLAKSIEAARVVMETRLGGMNEFRKSLEDLGSTFATKAEVKALDKLVQELRVTAGDTTGRRAIVSPAVAMLLAGIVSLVVGLVVGFVLR